MREEAMVISSHKTSSRIGYYHMADPNPYPGRPPDRMIEVRITGPDSDDPLMMALVSTIWSLLLSRETSVQ